ncbi:MAG: ABC transporter ATP-binding protein [Legionellaceae bacterium]|nr:ABC transporter ATP-binding protein [Legionellaceae bacterium]
MYALEIQNLRKTYPNGIEALKGISLNVERGDFFALLGANGAGKSTTIGLITTLLHKTSGTIHIEGYCLDRQSQKAKACVGLVPQEVNLSIFDECEQVLLNQAGYYGIPRQEAKKRADRLLSQLGLEDKRHSPVRQLSGGMKRRLMIARGLIHQPKVLILDEPTAGVDIEVRRSMWNFLQETNARGTTIILTTHYLEEAENLCKNIAIISGGKLVENTSMHALLQTLHQQSFVFNTETAIGELPDLSPFYAKMLDSNSFELRFDRQYALNDIFTLLDQKGLRIHSMRNKSNRLEALFLDRIKHD